ncbi:MAG TPA: thiol-disulfide isomerase [Candidatus Dormibacteraeota bacterium]|nr:thiol-disulfide isomerase [Candidatus Dormibacteraeota bacterium]
MALVCWWPVLTVPGQQVPNVRPETRGGETFYRDVLPVLQAHCQECHRAQGIAPMAFETYEQTRPYADAIRVATQNKAMPPWFADPSVGKFSNDPSLSEKEIATFANWAASHAPAGEQRDAPAARIWAEGWTIPEPDTVLEMPQAVSLPASGDIDYTYEIVPTHFTEGRWVQMAEILPSQHANVHHAVVYVRPPDSPWLRHAPVGTPFTAAALTDPRERAAAMWTDSDILLVYAPGSSPDNWPATMAKFIPAGSDLVFQMHYTSNGKAVSDRTKVGLRFAKEPPPQRVLTLQLTNDHFVIPPGAPDYRVEARGTLPNEATLLSFFPHMHLRGKRFEYNLIRHSTVVADHNVAPTEPSAAVGVEPLLRVNYHFHWQMSYRLAKPLHLPAGTELQAVAWFDNSRNNPHNPDPDSAVRWGEQTYDEMMVGFFDVAVDAKLDKRAFFVRH